MFEREVNIQKFGGTSVESLERFQQSCLIVERDRKDRKGTVVVVSAMSGVTNQLIAAGSAAVSGDLDLSNRLIEQIQNQHLVVIEQLEKSKFSDQAETKVIEVIKGTRELLKSIKIFGEITPRAGDLIRSAGERMSPFIFCACLDETGIPVTLLDAGQIIKTNDYFGNASPIFHLIESGAIEMVSPEIEQEKVAVMGGFYGTTASGIPTTLGRGGSDFSATILGKTLHGLGYNLNAVYLNKADVAGVLTASPKIVPDAFLIPHLSRNESATATMLGTEVVYARAIEPLPQDIPLFVRSTLEPDKQGTRIDSEAYDYGLPVKIITTVPKLKLLSVSGSGMDKPGTAEIIFRELARNDINNRAFTQPPTERVIQIVIPSDAKIDPVINNLRESFSRRIETGDIATIDAEDVSLVGIVGDGVRRPDVMEKIFRVLREEESEFNGYNGDSKSGRVVYIGPSDHQYSLVIRGDNDGEFAKSLVRSFHQVLITDRYNSK